MKDDRTFMELNDAEVDALIEGHIGRVAADQDAMPADVFVELLVERMESQHANPVTLSVAVHEDQLEILPDHEGTDILVHGNEIFIGGRRLVLRLAKNLG